MAPAHVESHGVAMVKSKRGLDEEEAGLLAAAQKLLVGVRSCLGPLGAWFLGIH